MGEDFSKNLVKRYAYWEIYIHKNQGYLGRCIIWCKRENVLDLADATPEEQRELFLVLHDLREASKEVFQPDWFNYSFLGNVMPHLHGHFIPRYAKPRTFMGMTFTDELYGNHYDEDKDITVPEEVLQSMKNELAKALR